MKCSGAMRPNGGISNAAGPGFEEGIGLGGGGRCVAGWFCWVMAAIWWAQSRAGQAKRCYDPARCRTRRYPMPRHASYVPHGVIPAVLLPFHDDLSIDEASFRSHLRDVAAAEGISAITINAHSTEVASCTFDEQRRVLEIAQDEIGGRLPIVNGIWADGSLEAARIARMAADGGASALLVFPPAPFTLRPVAGDGARALQAHRRRHRPADHRVPVSARDRPGLSARHAAQDVRAGAVDPRHQGLGRQRAAAREADPHAAEPAAAGERAHHPQRLAVLARWCSAATACCPAPAA